MSEFGPRVALRPPRADVTTGLALAALAIAYLAMAFVIPMGSEAPIIDEPIYAKSAFEWARTGQIQISNLSAPNAVFDTVWGGLFVRIFGETLSALRVSSLVLTAASAPFLFWMCRSIGAGRPMSVFGTAAFLFTPLALPLSSVFMTDAHATALSVIAMSLLSAAYGNEARRTLLFFLGSLAASLAFLSRPQSVVVALAALVVVLGAGHFQHRWGSLTAIVLPVVSTIWAHALWTSRVGEPFIRGFSVGGLTDRIWSDGATFLAMTLISGALYVGLFALPFLPALWPAARELHARRRTAIVLITGLIPFATVLGSDVRDPIRRQAWLSPSGLGGVDRSLLGQRPDLWTPGTHMLLGLALLTSTFALALSLPRRWRYRNSDAARWFLVLSAAGFVAAALLSSVATFDHIPDRYWLPVLPVVVAFAASSASVTKNRLGLSTALLLIVASFSVIGTRDAFVAHKSVLAFANEAIASGIDPLLFDGGAAWSAVEFGVHEESLAPITDRSGPFWVKFYAVHTEPEYGVALEPLSGYEVLGTAEYESVLHTTRTFIYLIHRSSSSGYFIDADDY